MDDPLVVSGKYSYRAPACALPVHRVRASNAASTVLPDRTLHFTPAHLTSIQALSQSLQKVVPGQRDDGAEVVRPACSLAQGARPGVLDNTGALVGLTLTESGIAVAALISSGQGVSCMREGDEVTTASR